MKILLSAYACEPDEGSEQEVGWRWANELSSMGNEVYVLTRLSNKKSIESKLKNKKNYSLKFIYFDYPKWILKKIKPKSNKTSYLYFYLWQIGIYFVAKKIIKKIKFDYIHHVTLVSYRFPSFLCFLNIPFIFGPISGGEEIPPKLKKNFDIKSKIKENIREINNFFIKFYPILNLCFKKAKKIIVTTVNTKEKIPKKYHKKTIVELAIAPDNYCRKKRIIKNFNSNKFQMCFAGNFLFWKGLIILLNVLKKLKENDYNFLFNFYGEGPKKKFIKDFINNNNLKKNVKFFGRVKRNTLKIQMKKNHLFIYPSLRDSGGYVVIEAMSVGLPAIVLSLGGPAQIVNKNCGIIINAANKNQDEIINDFYSEIVKLIINRNKIKEMSKNCFIRIKSFNFKNKIKKIYE